MTSPRPEDAMVPARSRVRPSKARLATCLLAAAVLALTAAPAQAVTTSSTGWHPVSGTDRTFHADSKTVWARCSRAS